MRYINTFQEGEQISDIYFCKQKTVAQTKAGKTYYSLILQDMTGTIDAKIWELSNAIEHFYFFQQRPSAERCTHQTRRRQRICSVGLHALFGI